MPNEDLQKDSPVEVIPSRELITLYCWKASARPFKKRGKEFWTTVLAIVFLIILILIFAKEWFLIVAIISITFVYYVLSTVNPEELEYKITNRGVVYAGQTYLWENLAQFWFTEKYGQKLVNFVVKVGYPVRLIIVVPPEHEKQVRDLLLKYLVEQEVKPNFLEKSADWLQRKVPLEETGNTPPIASR